MKQYFGLKKNLWSLFLIILFLGAILLVLISFFQYKNIEKDLMTEICYLSNITKEGTKKYFIQQETILDILSKQLFDDGSLVDYEKIITLFEKIIEVNPSIAGLAIADTDGNIMLTNNIKNSSSLPSLKRNYSFNKSLTSSNPVIGKAFFDPSLNEWILPIHKSIKDNSNKPIAVLSIGMHLDNTRSIWRGYTSSEEVGLEVFIGDTWHRIYHSKKPPATFPNMYKRSVIEFEQNYKEIEKELTKKSGLTFDELKKSGECITILYSFKDSDKKFFVSWQYLKEFDLWLHYHRPTTSVLQKVINHWSINIISFIFIFFFVFYLFKTIDKIQKEKSKELLNQALQDNLTKLPNRLYLQKNIDSWIHKDAPSFSVGFIDLDNFKNINDSLGHQYGDMILIEVAKRLRAILPKETIIVRHGGDEFIMLCNESDKDRLSLKAKELIESLSKPYEIEQMQFTIGLSIGISRYPVDGKTFFELLSAADIAMYHAKKSKNSFSFFTPELKSSRKRYSLIEQELRGAIEKGEIMVAYQPQMTKDEKLFGVEALARWKNQKLGVVSPEEFIKVAEESGLMPKIGKYLIDKIFKEIGALQQDSRKICIAINISIRQFNEKEFVSNLLESIGNSRLSPSQVIIEITESLFMEESTLVNNKLKKLKDKSLKISLDDFGTGYSSIGMLKKIDIDELKIDKSFVSSILTDQKSEAMIKAITTLGKNLGIDIVAEGVENKEQFLKLKELDCNLFQGYYFSKPIDIDELKRFIERYGVSKSVTPTG